MAGRCYMAASRQLHRHLAHADRIFGLPNINAPSRFSTVQSTSRKRQTVEALDDSELLTSLRAQIKHENQVGFLQDSRSPPDPFKLIDDPNTHEVFLRRSFGEEDIEISCVYHDQTYGDTNVEEGFDPPPNVPMKMVQMTIRISLGSDKPYLQIVCCTVGEKSTIEQVLLKADTVKPGEAPYEGPDISLLSDKLKSGFLEYLAARGIDNQLGKFLVDFMPKRVQQKYLNWLNKIQGFVVKT